MALGVSWKEYSCDLATGAGCGGDAIGYKAAENIPVVAVVSPPTSWADLEQREAQQEAMSIGDSFDRILTGIAAADVTPAERAKLLTAATDGLSKRLDNIVKGAKSLAGPADPAAPYMSQLGIVHEGGKAEETPLETAEEAATRLQEDPAGRLVGDLIRTGAVGG